MPKAQAKKEAPVSKVFLRQDRDKETGKELEVDALHALTVLEKQGKYEVLEHKATLGALSAFCDIHEIRYPGGGTVEQLVALAVRK